MAKVATFSESVEHPGWWEMRTPYDAEFMEAFKAAVPAEDRKPVRDGTGRHDHWLIRESVVDDARMAAEDFWEVESE